MASVTPEEVKGLISNRWLTTILLKTLNINDIVTKMDAKGIECRRLWNPMHAQPYYCKYPSYVNGFSEELFNTGLCLPSGKLGDVTTVCNDLLKSS